MTTRRLMILVALAAIALSPLSCVRAGGYRGAGRSWGRYLAWDHFHVVLEYEPRHGIQLIVNIIPRLR